MSKLSIRFAVAAISAAIVGAATPAVVTAQDDALGRALRDELARSIKELKLDPLERPYYIAYRVREGQGFEVSATMGSLLNSEESRGRSFVPEVHVGDYAFDNTNFNGSSGGLVAIGVGRGSPSMSFFGGLPLDDNYLELRRQIWLATDAAYKEAAETFAAKKAALLNRARRDSLADFTRITPTRTTDEMPSLAMSRAEAESLVRDLSAVPELAHLSHSSVTISLSNSRSRLITSEGTTSVVSLPLFTLSATAATQSADGAPLQAGMRVYARSLQSIPSRDQLTQSVRTLALRLDSLRSAPILDRYTGPVIVEGRAAGELFAEVFAPALAGRRRSEGGPDFAAMMEASGRGVTTFTEKLGSRVLPTFLSVVDDPTSSERNGQPLFGNYKVDDDGVAGVRKTVIDNGYLKLVLTTRTPLQGSSQATGNHRRGGATPSNLIVTSTAGVSDAELKSKLLALVKQRGLDYGVMIRELGSAAMVADDPMSLFNAMRGRGAGRRVLRAYRVYPDGREELVRGVRLSDATTETFKDILAVSTSETVLHRPAFGGSDFPFPIEMMEMMEDTEPSMALASYVVPAMLFEDLSLTRDTGERPKPPLSGPPGSR